MKKIKYIFLEASLDGGEMTCDLIISVLWDTQSETVTREQHCQLWTSKFS